MTALRCAIKLLPYVQHTPGCNMCNKPKYWECSDTIPACDCGLDQALEECRQYITEQSELIGKLI